MLLGLCVAGLAQDAERDRWAELNELRAELEELEQESRRRLLQDVIYERLTAALRAGPWAGEAGELVEWFRLLFSIHDTRGMPAEELDATLEAVLAWEAIDAELAERVSWEYRRRRLRPGAEVPGWKLTPLNGGEPVALADFAGLSVLLVVWSAADPHAAVLLENWVPAQLDRFAGRLVAVGLSHADGESETRADQTAFLDEHPIGWPLLDDPTGAVLESYFTLGRRPCLYAIDEEGKLLGIGRGWDGLGAVERALSEHLDGDQ